MDYLAQQRIILAFHLAHWPTMNMEILIITYACRSVLIRRLIFHMLISSVGCVLLNALKISLHSVIKTFGNAWSVAQIYPNTQILRLKLASVNALPVILPTMSHKHVY